MTLRLNACASFDPVAYVRYASVYRDFDTLDGFIQEIREYQAAGGLPSEEEVSQLSLIPNEFAVPTKRTGRRGRRPGMTQPLNGSTATAD